jgi:C4-dicarboxylate transporter, DctM subunit
VSNDVQAAQTADNRFSVSGLLDNIARWSQSLAAVILFALMVFTFIVVLMRYVFNAPIRGDVDITQLVSLIITWLGVAWGQVRKSHLNVDIITQKLKPRSALMVSTATYIMVMAVVSVMAWQGFNNTLYFMEHARSSTTYAIPLTPVAAMIPLGAFLLLLILARDFIKNLSDAARAKWTFWEWLLTLGIPVVILIGMYIWMQPVCHGMLPKSTVAFLGIFMGLVFIFLGMPIGPSLAITGFVFVGNILNATQGFGLAGADLFWQSSDYSWSTIQLFILMSEFIVISGIGEDAFTTAYKWLGRLRGGLAIATIGACTLLAAVVGIPAPVIYAMGAVALPAMRKYNYSDVLAAGVIAGGSCLGPLIPPSVSFIFYGIFTGVSIGKLFIAGILPGLLLSLAFMVTIYIWCRINPAMGGAMGEKFTWKEKFNSLGNSAPIALLFVLVMGGIYMGVFTTTEGGGIGAFLALIIAMAMGRVNWKNFKGSMMEAARTNAVMIFMVMGSMIMGRVLTVGGLGNMLAAFLGGLSPSMVVIAILIFYFIIGFFVDTVTVLILTMPVLTPILKATGIDLIWFGVELVMVINLGAYTPPYGLNMFILASSTDLKLGTIYRGVWPFVFCNLAICVVIFLLPAVATWLPNVIKG